MGNVGKLLKLIYKFGLREGERACVYVCEKRAQLKNLLGKNHYNIAVIYEFSSDSFYFGKKQQTKK